MQIALSEMWYVTFLDVYAEVFLTYLRRRVEIFLVRYEKVKVQC